MTLSCKGCVSLALFPKALWRLIICFLEASSGVLSTIHCTLSVQGGVVREPLKA